MKYPILISEIIFPEDYVLGKAKTVNFSFGFSSLRMKIFNHINRNHLPYYIQEVKKLLKGKRTKELEIHITDDPEYDIPDNYILANKDYTYHPEQPEKKLETTELLEFLQIWQKNYK